MNLGEQLHELRSSILRDRSDLIAGDSDSMWSDETLLRYIQDAERRFARDTTCIRDGTTLRYVQIKIRAGVRDYPLDPAVFAVVSARVTIRDYDLQRTGHALVQSRVVDTSNLSFDPAQASTISPGAPIGFYTDETAVFAQQHRVTFSVFPLPDTTSDGTLVNMRVARLPCPEYTRDDLNRESELPLDYQLDALQWAAYRAKQNNDVDISAMPAADDHKLAFEDAVKRCKRDMHKRMHVATGLRYGRNGFSWGR